MSGSDRRAEATVLVKSPARGWEAIASGEARGATPEGLTLSANEWGPDTMSFAVRRDPAIEYDSLTAFNPCEVLIDGRTVWGGRVWEAPQTVGAEDIIQVQGRGWQYHLDDDPVDVGFVHTRMSEWIDGRSHPDANLVYQTASPMVVTGDAAVVIGWPTNSQITALTGVGVTLDLGPNRRAREVRIEFDTVNPNAFATVYCRGTDDGTWRTGGASEDGFAVAFNAIGSPAIASFSSPWRYVHIFMYSPATTGVAGGDHLFRMKAIRVFTDPSYVTSNQSNVTLDDVIRDLLATGSAPLLSSDLSRVAASSFVIDTLWPDGYQTMRSIIAAANAYEGNLVGVDALGQVFSRERATVPELEIGEWSGSQFNDASTNSAESLYDQVLVQATTPDGVPIAVLRTATGTLLGQQGFHRTAIFPVSTPITTLIAEQLGDVWLDQRSTPQFKGSATAQGYGAVRHVLGGGVHASALLEQGGNLLRVGHLITPEGDVARDGIIRSVQYVHDTETATCELDNERGNFDTFMSRLGAIASRTIRAA